ncbi:MAG: outer membrane beta-barrel protein, partial [Chrysiogenetes bacterium]|nr:outer membrane beta-barrel protein [Chrysiogenetes bacterium]
TQLMALSIRGSGESLFGGAEVLQRVENASNLSSVSGAASGTARIFAAMGILGWNWDPVAIGIRAEWIHVSDPDNVVSASAWAGQAIGPSNVLIGDGDVYGGSVFLTWVITRGVFVRGEYRLDAADYDTASTALAIINPDTAKAHLGLLQVNASFE